MDSLLHHVLRRAASFPDQVFVHRRLDDGVQSVTNAQFAALVRRCALGVAEDGAVAGTCVPIIADNGIGAMAAFLGVMWAGAIPTFLPYPSSKQDPETFRRTHLPLFRRLRVELAICQFPVPGLEETRVTPLDELLERHPVERDLPLPAADAPALLQHSSGTTGTKKGVILSHRAILAQIAAYGPVAGFGPGDIVATWLPLYHDMGLVTGFLLPLVLDGGVASLDPFVWSARPWWLLEMIDAHRASHCWLPNFAFHHMVRTAPAQGKWDLSSLKRLVSCSEPAKPKAFADFAARFSDHGLAEDCFAVCYAMAENVFAVTQSAGPLAATRIAAGIEVMDCGPPLPGVTVEIRQPDSDGFGEIVLRSPFLFDGYYRQPEKTAEVLDGDAYRTGDIGRLDENGRLYVAGRIDDRLCVYGRNVHAYDVEAALLGVPGLAAGRSVVFGRFDEQAGTHALIVVAECDDQGDPGLKRRIRDEIAAQMGITVKTIQLVPRGWLTKTTSGKVSRSENMTRYLNEFQGEAGAQR
jgi:fatty-acyl-CoA synthase